MLIELPARATPPYKRSASLPQPKAAPPAVGRTPPRAPPKGFKLGMIQNFHRFIRIVEFEEINETAELHQGLEKVNLTPEFCTQIYGIGEHFRTMWNIMGCVIFKCFRSSLKVLISS